MPGCIASACVCGPGQACLVARVLLGCCSCAARVLVVCGSCVACACDPGQGCLSQNGQHMCAHLSIHTRASPLGPVHLGPKRLHHHTGFVCEAPNKTHPKSKKAALKAALPGPMPILLAEYILCNGFLTLWLSVTRGYGDYLPS